MVITFSEASDGGYMYDIYLATPEEVAEGRDSEDGGQCTTTLENAVDMVVEQAKAIMNRKNV